MIPIPERQNTNFTTMGGSFKYHYYSNATIPNPCQTPLKKAAKVGDHWPLFHQEMPAESSQTHQIGMEG
jgi:hypothetical protein